MKNNAMALALPLLVGCSTPPPAQVAGSDDRLVCTREEKIGSILPRMVCRSPAEVERDREDVRAWDQQRMRPVETPPQDR